MTPLEELRRRVYLKKQLIELTQEDIKEMVKKIKEAEDLITRGCAREV